MQELSNAELIRRLVGAGPEDGLWMEFVSRFQKRIRSTVFRSLGRELARNPKVDSAMPAEVVDDLTQEVFIRLLEADRQALARFQGRNENSFYTYLNTIAVNLVRDHFKKLRAQRTPPAASSIEEPLRAAEGELTLGDLLAAAGDGPEELARAAELRERLGAAVDRVSGGKSSRRDRLIFRLHFEEGLTVEQIAAHPVIELSPSGVEKCIRRLRGAIREILDEQGGAVGENSSQRSMR